MYVAAAVSSLMAHRAHMNIKYVSSEEAVKRSAHNGLMMGMILEGEKGAAPRGVRASPST